MRVGATKHVSLEGTGAERSKPSVPATMSSVLSVGAAAGPVRVLLRAAASAPATVSVAACAAVKVGGQAPDPRDRDLPCPR